MLCRHWRVAGSGAAACRLVLVAPAYIPLRRSGTPCRSGLFQGIDLFDLDDASENEADNSVALDPSALLSDSLITGQYLRTIYTTGAQPVPYSSSVAVKRLKRKGRGLVAAAPIAAGELVLVSEPLVAVEGQGPSSPQVADLVRHLQASKFSTQQHEVFSLLYTGRAPPPDLPTPDLKGLCPWNYPPSAALPAPLPLPPDDILGIVQHNAFGDAHADLVLATLRGEAPRSMLGIWPEAAMINHSCAPNAVHFLLAGHMVVRATLDIPVGEEITLNYLGRGALAPVGARQEELQGSYGFVCKCARCRLEARLVEDFGPVLEAVSEALEEVQAVVPEVLRGGGAGAGGAGEGEGEEEELGPEALGQVLGMLGEMDGVMAETRRRAGVGPLDWLWLQAAAYDLYQLVALLLEHAAGLAQLPPPEQAQQQQQQQEAGQEPTAQQQQPGSGQNHQRQPSLEEQQQLSMLQQQQPSALQQRQQQQQLQGGAGRGAQLAALKALARCVEVAGAAVPGSDLHALAACKFLERVQAVHGGRPGDARVLAAQSMAFQAVKARYGALDADTVRLLVERNAEVARQLDDLLPYAAQGRSE